MKATDLLPRWRAVAVLTSVLVTAGAAKARAQSAAADSGSTASSPPHWTFGGWIAGATGQPLETRLGHVHDRDLFISAIRASRPLVVSPRFRLTSTVDLFPLVVATANREYAIVPVALCAPDGFCIDAGDTVATSRRTAYAAGVAPLGFEAIYGVARSVGLSVGVEGGALYFNRRIPDPGETRFNFMADASAALRVSLGAMRPTLVTGFQINHISNGGTGRVNPGMDSRMLFVGLER